MLIKFSRSLNYILHSVDSKLYVNGNVTIAHNTATGNGGGVYLSTSDLNCQQKSTFVFYNNMAMSKGGGVHALSSSINSFSNIIYLILPPLYESDMDRYYKGAKINFTNNEAKFGGGLLLADNAKLKINIMYPVMDTLMPTVSFIGNSADYGGAIFVDDETNSGMCAGYREMECFSSSASSL